MEPGDGEVEAPLLLLHRGWPWGQLGQLGSESWALGAKMTVA